MITHYGKSTVFRLGAIRASYDPRGNIFARKWSVSIGNLTISYHGKQGKLKGWPDT